MNPDIKFTIYLLLFEAISYSFYFRENQSIVKLFLRNMTYRKNECKIIHFCKVFAAEVNALSFIVIKPSVKAIETH